MGKIGALSDLFPRKNSPEYMRLPPFVRDDIDLLRKGFRPMSPGALAEHNMIPKRMELLGQEVHALGAKVDDVHAGQSELGEKLIPLVQSVLDELRALGARVTSLEARLNDHAARLDKLERAQRTSKRKARS